MFQQTQNRKGLHILLAASLSLSGFRAHCQDKALHYDTDSKTYYNISNDSSELHVQIMTIELAQQRKILLNGLELWLDPKGKKNKSTGILFPLPAKTKPNTARSFSPFPGNDTNKHDDRKMLHSWVETHKEMKLMNIEQSSGLSVSLHFEGDTLVYRADIPFTVFSPAIALNKSLGIGIIEKGMQLPDFGGGDMPGGGPGGGPGGDGGPPGGGMMADGPPPGGFQGDDDIQKLFADDKIWIRITLSPDQAAR